MDVGSGDTQSPRPLPPCETSSTLPTLYHPSPLSQIQARMSQAKSRNGSAPLWSLEFSNSQRKEYYFHRKTKQRFWREPSLPSGWAFEWKDGRKWFRNVFTGKGCWSINEARTLGGATVSASGTSNGASGSGSGGGGGNASSSSNSSGGGGSGGNPFGAGSNPFAAAAGNPFGASSLASASASAPTPAAKGVVTSQKTSNPIDAAPAPLHKLLESDARVGFPSNRPPVNPCLHGWFYPPHRAVMGQLVGPHTKCIIELGSWYGMSTKVSRVWFCLFLLLLLFLAVARWPRVPCSDHSAHSTPHSTSRQQHPTRWCTPLTIGTMSASWLAGWLAGRHFISPLALRRGNCSTPSSSICLLTYLPPTQVHAEGAHRPLRREQREQPRQQLEHDGQHGAGRPPREHAAV